MNLYVAIKRFLDFTIAFLALSVLWPAFLIIAAMIKLESKGPVHFKQRRIGKGKTEFYIYKYRTMKTDTPSDMPTHLLENPEKYITKTGKLLRKFSLDELPQIINILKGEMSIIGPRPALWNQFDLIEQRDKYGANDIWPGLSGWAQVNGRDGLSISEKARMDGYYRRNLSFGLDARIFLMTVIIVLGAKGVVEGAQVSPVYRQNNAEREVAESK